MPLENERPGMFAPRDGPRSQNPSTNVPPLARGQPNRLQRPEQQQHRQGRQGSVEQSQRAAVEHQGPYRAYAPGITQSLPHTCSTELSGNGQSQTVQAKGVSDRKNNNRFDQCIDGVMHTGSGAPKHSEASSRYSPRPSPPIDLRHNGHQKEQSAVPPSMLQPPHVSTTTQPPIAFFQHRRLSPQPSLHTRRNHQSKPLPHLLPRHETETPGRINWHITNPDPVTPKAVSLCPIDYHTGRPEHRELHFGDVQPSVFLPEEIYLSTAPVEAVETYARTACIRAYMESYGRTQLPQSPRSKDVTVEDEEEDYPQNFACSVERSLAPLAPGSVTTTATLHTPSTPGIASAESADTSDHAHRPVAKISDYYQATRAWRFEHEEGVANEAPYPQKSAVEYVQPHANSPAVTASVNGEGEREITVRSLVEHRSSLDVVIGHFITENLERAVPTAAAILQHGVGSELAKHSNDRTTMNQ